MPGAQESGLLNELLNELALALRVDGADGGGTER